MVIQPLSRRVKLLVSKGVMDDHCIMVSIESAMMIFQPARVSTSLLPAPHHRDRLIVVGATHDDAAAAAV